MLAYHLYLYLYSYICSCIFISAYLCICKWQTTICCCFLHFSTGSWTVPGAKLRRQLTKQKEWRLRATANRSPDTLLNIICIYFLFLQCMLRGLYFSTGCGLSVRSNWNYKDKLKSDSRHKVKANKWSKLFVSFICVCLCACLCFAFKAQQWQ